MVKSVFLRLRLWEDGRDGIKCNKEHPRKQKLLHRHSNSSTVPQKVSTTTRQGQLLTTIQKYKILLTNVSKMDNEPGHERKVFVLKVDTGSSLMPDEAKLCNSPLPPP